MAVIPISFKESEAELYRFLKSKVSPSAYIKELLYKEINNIEASINSPINNTVDVVPSPYRITNSDF